MNVCRERNQSVTTSRNQVMQGYLMHPAGRIPNFLLPGVAAFQPTHFLGMSLFPCTLQSGWMHFYLWNKLEICLTI